jgi:hypothetical protein
VLSDFHVGREGERLTESLLCIRFEVEAFCEVGREGGEGDRNAVLRRGVGDRRREEKVGDGKS